MEIKSKASLHIREIDLIRIREIFQKLLPTATVYAYGSRVNGDAHDGSDLDLAIKSKNGEEISNDVLSKIRETFQESNIPILVDLHDFARLPLSFQKEILEKHVKIEIV